MKINSNYAAMNLINANSSKRPCFKGDGEKTPYNYKEFAKRVGMREDEAKKYFEQRASENKHTVRGIKISELFLSGLGSAIGASIFGAAVLYVSLQMLLLTLEKEAKNAKNINAEKLSIDSTKTSQKLADSLKLKEMNFADSVKLKKIFEAGKQFAKDSIANVKIK